MSTNKKNGDVMNRLKRWTFRIFLVTVALMIVVIVSLSILTNSATDDARAMLDSENVEEHRNYIVVKADIPRANIVFYQGGLVETEAYLIFADLLAQAGFTVYLPKMPLNLAILGQGEFASLKESYDDGLPWIGIGHSLGGASLGFVVDDDLMDGLIFLAAYPGSNQDLSDLSMPVLSITATNDDVLDQEAYEAARERLPAHAEHISIEGGNHAQFGHYGFQRGDGEATISHAEQQAQTLSAIVAFIETMLDES